MFVEVSVHMGLALLLLSLWGGSMAWQVDDMGGCIWWTNRFLDGSQKPERKCQDLSIHFKGMTAFGWKTSK